MESSKSKSTFKFPPRVSIFKLVSDLYNSGKKPRMSEFRSLAKRIKKMNPDITNFEVLIEEDL